jgi:hypothetical protein
MDYSICKALSYNMDDIPVALVMYDIMCQYGVHFKEQVKNSPELSLSSSLVSRPRIFYRFIWIYSDLFDRGFVSKSLSLDMIRTSHVICHVTYKPFDKWHMTLGESCHSHTDIHDWIDKPRA